MESPLEIHRQSPRCAVRFHPQRRGWGGAHFRPMGRGAMRLLFTDRALQRSPHWGEASERRLPSSSSYRDPFPTEIRYIDPNIG